MDNDANPQVLAPPALTAIKDAEVAKAAAVRGQLERSLTGNIQNEENDLREVAEQTLNVILDVDLDQNIRWVSPSWLDIVGSSPALIQGKPVADIILGDDKSVFADAIDALRKDVSGSKIVRFSVRMGKQSVFNVDQSDKKQTQDTEEGDEGQLLVLDLEAQGIMIYDRSSGAESHTMWMIRPAVPREVTIDLPDILIESLGGGADMLAQHLTQLAEHGTTDPQHHPPPLPVLCRICERQITPWWFPKHTDLCLQEHQAEAELHLAQESLTEHRNAIVKVLDALEAQSRHKSLAPPDAGATPPPQAEYKGMAVGSGSSQASVVTSPGSSPSRSAERPSSGLSHHRAKSFVVRRPLSRIVELVLDLCDTALEISQPSVKDTKGSDDDEVRTQSPQSEGRISQVLHWQSPSAVALENEPGLAALCEDTTALSKAKVEATMRFRRLLEYAERIRTEFTSLVQECIDTAMEKAAHIAAGGEISGESGDESAGKTNEEQEVAIEQETEKNDIEDEVEVRSDPGTTANTGTADVEESATEPPKALERQPSSFDGLGSMSMALRAAVTRSPSPSSSPRRRVSSAMSTRSSSPKSCATPKSQSATTSLALHQKAAAISAAESDAGADSDRSARSSFRSHSRSSRFSTNDLSSFSRVTTSRERKRTSLILPREQSMTRQESPGRAPMVPPVSPLRVTKPRLPSGTLESARSPIVSPTLASSEFASPTILPQDINHRRQSSAASSEVSRAAMSPRLTFANAPQPRAVPPSIRDFEIIKPISKGAFGSVYLAKKKSTGDYYAIKALKKQDMVAKNQVANVKAERAILMFQGESDFVAKLYWTFPSKDYIFLVMEYLNGGDCSSLVQALGTLPEDWAKKYLAEVVLGVEHLHGREIVHRDLKPDNLLIDQKGHLKLTDFGLSRMGLIGRQKRALSLKNSASAPDPLKQGQFHRSVSMTSSSRSASFDMIGSNNSPIQTPFMTPAFGAESSQPSYFSLSRDFSSGSREPTRQSSMHQSDNGDTDGLSTAFRRFSIYDDPLWSSTRASPKEEDLKELHESGDGFGLQQTTSNSSRPRNATPPQTTGVMAPPPMALFDPDDSNRRFVGTPDYLAPETINGLGQDEMSDWWSIGCILFEFLFGYPPFHAPTPDQVFENILHRRIEWPPEDEQNEVSAEAKDLMNKLMCLDPAERLGANLGEKYASGGDEIRNHPWFADIDWDTLNEAEASFVPAPENIEDTEYFDTRGATTEDFTAEFDDQATSLSTTPVGDFERPHDALSKVRSQVNSMKRGLMPLHIPPHVRDGRSRRLSEPVAADDFGQFSFKNLSVLEKANKDVIQKLRAEAMQAQSRSSQPPNPSVSNNSPPSLESSPVIGAPLKRALSTSRGNHRSASPSTLSLSNSSPSRVSQPSSPLVQFSAGGVYERRKASSGSSSVSQVSASLQPGSFFEVPKLSTALKTTSNSSSPIKISKSPSVLLDSAPANFNATSPRTRSQTVGANESDIIRDRVATHNKRRSQVIEISPSSSDTEDPRQKALLRVQRRRQSSRRMSQISLAEGPVFRPLDILVVEDHPVSRLVMEKLLEKLRCRAIIVNDGAEATRYAMSAVKFDIIMMEYKLPQVNGADVARMLRETKNANCHTPIVAVTGYLKELTAPHHFDALVEKPPTPAKLTEVMSRLCQWKPPTAGWSASQQLSQQGPIPPSSLRKESLAHDESPTSTGSGYPSLPSLSHRASSREDSMSTVSIWTDADGAADDLQQQKMTGASEWPDNGLGGLGISDGRSLGAPAIELPPTIPSLVTHESAPPDLGLEPEHRTPRKIPSAEKIEAKKRSLNNKDRADTGESGDDEDEELGILHIKTKSPKARPFGAHSRTSSKLATEMMRTNSQGAIVDSADDPARSLPVPIPGRGPALQPSAPPAPVAVEAAKTSPLSNIDFSHASLTPPEVFLRPGGQTKDIDMDEGKPSTPMAVLTPDPDPTPRGSNSPRHDD